MSPLGLVWLRRIALGLPLVAGSLVLVACESEEDGWCSGFDPMTREHRFALDEAQRASLDADGGVTCAQLCQLLESADGGTGYRHPGRCEVVDDGTGSTLECTTSLLCIGRPPAGLLAARGVARHEVGAFLARAAHLEAASVPAFLELASELALHDAPRSLVAAARRSAIDEARHARSMRALAASAGAAVPAIERAPSEPRSLRELALDNAVHGCAGEAHAALLAALQARRAHDPEVRRAHAEIARDEAGHALLSWAIDASLRPRLSARDRRAVEDARREAIVGIVRASEVEPSLAMRSVLGLPDAERAVTIARALAS